MVRLLLAAPPHGPYYPLDRHAGTHEGDTPPTPFGEPDRVDSPFEFDLAGMISDMIAPFARTGMEVFVVATQDSDYLMVRERDLQRATDELARAGFSLDP